MTPSSPVRRRCDNCRRPATLKHRWDHSTRVGYSCDNCNPHGDEVYRLDPPEAPAVAEPAPAGPAATSWLTVEAVAERVGVSGKTVYRALTAGALQGSKPSGPRGHWRIAPADVEAWVADGRPTGGSPRARPTVKDVTGRPAVNPDLSWNA